jgi:hypothetical protein
MRMWGADDGEACVESSDGRNVGVRLDVDGTVSLVGCHLYTNDFQSEIICQPIVGRQLNIILFTSCIVKHCKSKLQKALSCVTIGST